MPLTRSLPRMYHRRLLMIASGMLLVLALLSVQIVRLGVVQGAELRDEANRALQDDFVLPTYRGSILDRHGRVLAEDLAGYAAALHYTVIDGTWARTHAARQATYAAGKQAWREMSAGAQEAAIARLLPEWRDREARVFEALRAGVGIDAAELEGEMTGIRSQVEAVAAAVQRNRKARFLANGIAPDEVARLLERRELILEETVHHPIGGAIDDDVAFGLRRVARELREGDPLPEKRPMVAPLDIEDTRLRSRAWLDRVVALDRGSLPSPLRTEEPLRLELHDVADHIVGTVRPAYAQDVQLRPFRRRDGTIDRGGYSGRGDRIGARGIEAVMEETLRGERGYVVRRLDIDEEHREDPIPGQDVTLTIDYELQALVQGILAPELGLTRIDRRWQSDTALPEGTPLDASAVVLEVATGEILALVSSPEYGMMQRAYEQFERELGPERGAEAARAWVRRHAPWSHRPVETLQPPGSIVKPLVLAAAMSEGRFSRGETIDCTGHFFPDVTSFARCWIFREQFQFQSHGPLGGAEAIGRSCNMFFYTLADRLGYDGLERWFAGFGGTELLDAGLRYTKRRVAVEDDPATARDETVVEEYGAGELYAPLPPPSPNGARPRTQQIIAMGIGQQWTWTPLHAANAYATLARGGRILDATIVRSPDRRRAQRRPDLPLDPAAVEMALAGLRMSVEERIGTGHHLWIGDEREPIFDGLDGVRVWGKTGTAQAPRVDLDGDGTLSESERALSFDHAWFVGLVGRTQPEFAIAVLVELGGSGGRVSGPVAHQVIRAMQRLGYLPGDPLARGEGSAG